MAIAISCSREDQFGCETMSRFWETLNAGCWLSPHQVCVWEAGWWEVSLPDGDLTFTVEGLTAGGRTVTATAAFHASR